MPRPRLLRSRKMGNTSSQLANADEIESSQPTVPETPTANKRQMKKTIPSPERNSASPEVPATNGSEKNLNSDTSQPSKRKRDSEPERKRKSKKTSKPSQIEDEVTEEPSATPVAMDTEIPPTPTQPTPSRSARSKARQARKMKKDGTVPSTPSAQPAPEQELANHSSAPATPNPEGLLTPGGRPKSIRGSRTREKDSRKIGFFTPAEIQRIETFKIDFCTMHGFSGSTFDEMVQHSDRNKHGDFPVDTSIVSKSDFWNEIYDLIPERDRRSVYRFMRRHFQDSTQKAHDWTEEQDDELVDLIDKHGPKYTFIGKLLGRSDDDVTQRWKNKLEHRGTMNQGPWSVEETKIFFEAMQSTWANMKPMLGEKAAKDVYELDDGSVLWGNVSKAMNHKRSRQQCADKWRKIVKQVKTLRANGMPDAEFDVEASAKMSSRRIIRSNSSKSAKFVTEDDEDDDVNEQANGISNQSDAPEATKSPQPEPQIEPTPEAELPEPPSTSKKSKKSKSKSKSKRKHVDDHAQPENGTQSDADDEPELPPLPEQTDAERKKARKDAKRQKKAEKASKQTENENSDGSHTEHSGDERSQSNSPSSNLPKAFINEEADEDDSESEGNSDVMDIKNEYDSDEL